MRRALLTARPPAAGVTVGTIPANDTTTNAARAYYAPNNPASGTGTLTTGTVKLASNASIYFFTVNPTTMTVRAISANVSATSGLGTYTISLPVVAGDYIGVAGASLTIGVRSASGGTFASSTSSAPSVGASVSSYSSGSGTLCLSAST